MELVDMQCSERCPIFRVRVQISPRPLKVRIQNFFKFIYFIKRYNVIGVHY